MSAIRAVRPGETRQHITSGLQLKVERIDALPLLTAHCTYPQRKGKTTRPYVVTDKFLTLYPVVNDG